MPFAADLDTIAQERADLFAAPEPISAERVLFWLRQLAGYGDGSWIEIAAAIADASTDDPLFPGRWGPTQTAALLVALAMTTSGLHTSLIGKGGTAFGLFQIEIHDPHLSADVFLLPRSAAYCAIELLRQQLDAPDAAPLPERLSWYGEPIWKASYRLEIAQGLLAA